jgi:LuxR family maltose regulon positive regulatory protein
VSPNQPSYSEQPLLRTKISIPHIPSGFVHRPRLMGRMNWGIKGPLTLLSAPAGFGKTNLLTQWAEASELQVAWLTLDKEDNDLIRFFRYLIGALQTIEPQLGEEALEFIQSTKTSGVEWGLTLLINEISALPKEIALVMDELHVLEDPTIYRSLSFLLKYLPHNLHLLIASRSEPALDLAFLQVKGQVVELGADDLRFTSEEVRLFFEQTMGLQLSPETVLALEERTDGWITGLQIAAISLRHQANPKYVLASLQGDAHYLVDFLVEEVLDRQPEEVRQFLLRSSVLDVLSGPLCEAVVDPNSRPGFGASMLTRLEHANLFIIALDEKHEWFRYHRLFAEFLRHVQAEIAPLDIPLLQKRAAIWFERNGNLDEAFKHALAAGDGEWAANIIERNILVMINTGEFSVLTRWIGQLPEEVIQQRPRLCLGYAWGLIANYRLDHARFWLDNLQRILDDTGNQPDGVVTTDPSENIRSWNIQGGLAICRSTLALLSGDIQQAAEYTRETLKYLHEESPFIHSMLSLDESLYFILSGDTLTAIEALRKTARIARQANNLLVMIIATCQLAEMHVMQGHLNQALATLHKAQLIAIGPDGRALPLAGIVDIGFGEILLERDNLGEAREYLERGCQLTRAFWSLGNLDGMMSLARLLQTQGDVAGSQALITEVSSMVLSTESSQWDGALVSAIAVRLALQRHDLSSALQWWKKIEFSDLTQDISLEKYPYHVFEYLLLTQARSDLVIGLDPRDKQQIQRTLDLLQSLLPKAEQYKRFTAQIEILVLQAIAQYALGEADQAVKTFLRALAMGEPEGYRRIYLDEGRPIVELLSCCLSVPRERDDFLPTLPYIESLLAAGQREAGASGLHPTDSTTEFLFPPPITERRFEPATAKTQDGMDIFLSAREIEVLSLIADGKSNREISAELVVTLNTVKRHAYNIYSKLDVRKRTQAVSKACQLGLIP